MITATGERLGFSGIKVALTRGCLHRLDPRAAAPRRKPVLLPLAIMLPEDTFALTEQLLKANEWHNHAVATCSRMCGSTDNTVTGARSQTAVAELG